MFSRIAWRLAIPCVVPVLVILFGLTLLVPAYIRDAEIGGIEERVLSEANRLTADIPKDVSDPTGNLVLKTQEWATQLGVQVTLVTEDGEILAQSHATYATGDNLLYRPEVQQALDMGQGTSSTLGTGPDSAFVRAAVSVPGQTRGSKVVVHLALSLASVMARYNTLRTSMFVVALLGGLLTLSIVLLSSQSITSPLRHMTEIVQQIALGDMSVRMVPTTTDEFGQFMVAFNDMADGVRQRVDARIREHDEQAALLEYMADGVVIVDELGRVKLINSVASRLLSTEQTSGVGLSFAQVARDHRLIEIGQMCRETGEEQSTSIELERQGVFLRVVATPLGDVGTQRCLIVLQDLTQIRRLETVRRDFISNISHELLTPISSLKALVETLRYGALDDPPAAERFLDRIEVEVDDMTQIVQELLELSRAESGRVPLHLAPTAVVDLIVPPMERLQAQAERAELTITALLPPLLPEVLVDADRIREVVTNLIHNALKFTPTGGSVTVAAEPKVDEVVISVKDTGVGIAAEDLPRIFERFFKGDRARRSGGTGLGLAIARHILEAHDGRIWVESIEGRGSTFYFALPVANGTMDGNSDE